ncbi:MAG TPA: DMT family transporter [Syntrophomonas sp.]|nr:DMT family transporter [Syntrophomonas sp.]
MRKSFLYVLGAAFLFGTMEVALKLAGAAFNPVQLTFLRFLIGGVFLLPFAVYDLKQRQYRLTCSDWLYLFLLGLICICISMILFQLGIMRTNANLAAIIISTSPVFTMLFAHFIADEKLTVQKGIVLVLNLIGLIIVADPVTLLKGKASVAGIILTLAAAVTFGLYTAMGKRKIDNIGGLAQNSFSFILGSVVLLIVLLFTHQPIVDGIRMGTLPLLIYTGVFVTGVGYFCYTKAVELSGPSTASLTFFIKPIFAPFIALAVLNEAITVNVILGVIFILAGSLVNLAYYKLSDGRVC